VHLDGAEFGALVDASTFGGTSGNILITADSLLVENGAVVSTQTFDPSVADGGNIQIQAGSTAILAAGQITSSSFGSGAGGQIQIAGTSLELDGGSSIQCSAQGTGNAGGVTLNLDGSVRLAHNSSLSVSSAASDGGNISVIAGDDIRVKDSSITASAANNGGDITLKADKLVYFLNSTLTAEATTGNGGNINIDPPLVVFNNSSINANSADAAGGDISIIASGFLASGTPITASGAQAGTISIQTPDQDITDELASLEEEPIDAETLLQPHCGVKLKNISTFSVLSRGTPVAPNQLLPSLP
jgi:large exoprotein involved in heme utilization and adhesion